MLRIFKSYGWLGALVVGLQPVLGFSLLKPFNEAWQTTTIGYNIPWMADIGGPANFDEGYRWNTPTNYYAVDQTFTDFFGSNGVVAVEQAFALLNNTLTNLSGTDLNEIPTEGNRINQRAAALSLLDVKSATLAAVLEELGLASAERYVWTLYSRVCVVCPGECTYYVVMRNFDPFTFLPSPYINGQLYDYVIWDNCGTTNYPPQPMNAVAQTYIPGNSSDYYSTSASGFFSTFGTYITRLTQDDVGGLRYLLRTNNIVWESTSSDTTEYITNGAVSQVLYTSNLMMLADLALTNSDANLATLYPGLTFNTPGNVYPVVVTNTVITSYVTNPPYGDYGTQITVYATNYQWGVQLRYTHDFGNLAVVQYLNGAWTNYLVSDLSALRGHAFVTLQTVKVASGNSPYTPYASTNVVTTTNVTALNFATNDVVGEFFILPAGSCAMQLLDNLITLTNTYTNLLSSFTNMVVNTNSVATNSTGTGVTNLTIITQNLITYSTNHVLWALPVTCVGTNSTLREGMNCIQFERSSYDSLLGRFFQPITNYYQSVIITNGMAAPHKCQRIVAAPDFTFSSLDLATFSYARTDTATNFKVGNALPGLAGPGNIDTEGMWIHFNRLSPFLINAWTTNQAYAAITNFTWASFDGSTNDPVLYPLGTSLTALENEILFQIGGVMPVDGTVGQPYSELVPVSGGEAPYTWVLTPGSAPLPPGLGLSSAGVLAGTPTQSGQFAFTVTVTDAGARSTTQTVGITIDN